MYRSLPLYTTCSLEAFVIIILSRCVYNIIVILLRARFEARALARGGARGAVGTYITILYTDNKRLLAALFYVYYYYI